MPNWTPRDPSSFPINFYNTARIASRYPNEAFVLMTFRSKKEAKAYLNHFRYWRFCLREWPTTTNTPAALLERGWKISGRVEGNAEGWQIAVTAKTRAVDLLPAGLIDYASI